MRDDLGADVPLTTAPRRVVSLVPSLTEVVAPTGTLVGATDYCTHPPELAVPRVGGSKYPDVAAVRALAPDLVIANSEENRPEEVGALRAAGVPVWVTRAPETVPMALASARRLFTEVFRAPVPGWLPRAEQLWGRELPERAVAVVPVWRKPWVVLGRDTFAGDVLLRLGVRNAYADHAERYPRPPLEELRASAADLVVLPDEPYEFTADDGPGFFPGKKPVLVNGRYLTWYGPSLLAAWTALDEAIGRAL
ncbi:helical backbone metal receptor [Actinokineospora bangkokensis]|uniref:Cobalamin-binding protein n=1 Tax=Actinokineospora bangkokensis TaxID=1193682 RepID=A0A1Q9LDT1_9PSEU|nr:helical backbone metal receptor [Actinokineospora bangkokensis]OLR90198.1 cobalamin-binding protein [Actinokineospora bangkokensis]